MPKRAMLRLSRLGAWSAHEPRGQHAQTDHGPFEQARRLERTQTPRPACPNEYFLFRHLRLLRFVWRRCQVFLVSSSSPAKYFWRRCQIFLVSSTTLAKYFWCRLVFAGEVLFGVVAKYFLSRRSLFGCRVSLVSLPVFLVSSSALAV